jgi:hypothetical protein
LLDIHKALQHSAANDQLAPGKADRLRFSMLCSTAIEVAPGVWMTKKLNPKLAGPPDLAEIARISARREAREGLQPTAGDLLSDVYFLEQQIARESDDRIRGIYARSTIVMSVATIEAITNDALTAIYDLMTESVPLECLKVPPRSHFKGRSTDRIRSLLRRGLFSRKQQYVLAQIERTTGHAMESALINEIDQLRSFRNRIVHMRRDRYGANLDDSQAVLLAERAYSSARSYQDFLTAAFAGLNLPIRTVRLDGTEPQPS